MSQEADDLIARADVALERARRAKEELAAAREAARLSADRVASTMDMPDPFEVVVHRALQTESADEAPTQTL